MKSRKIAILIPSDSPTGPIKGAYALANELVRTREVFLVNLKRGPGADSVLDKRIKCVSLDGESLSFRKKSEKYQSILKAMGGREELISISFCFSADLINAFCRKYAITCSSVRGNLFFNYRLDYGISGSFLAAGHLFGLRFFDFAVAMNTPMAKQIRRFSGRDAAIIGNFVDEPNLEKYRLAGPSSDKPLSFVFLGSLTERKQPWLIVDAIEKLRESGVNAIAHLIGSGPKLDMIESLITNYGFEDRVFLHGFLSTPYSLLAQADAMVLPSLSEGLSRSALEALYLGVPCVLRDADGNSELIKNGINGTLFTNPEDLPSAMLRSAEISRRKNTADLRPSLLPAGFRQEFAAHQYLKLVEKIN